MGWGGGPLEGPSWEWEHHSLLSPCHPDPVAPHPTPDMAPGGRDPQTGMGWTRAHLIICSTQERLLFSGRSRCEQPGSGCESDNPRLSVCRALGPERILTLVVKAGPSLCADPTDEPPGRGRSRQGRAAGAGEGGQTARQRAGPRAPTAQAAGSTAALLGSDPLRPGHGEQEAWRERAPHPRFWAGNSPPSHPQGFLL